MLHLINQLQLKLLSTLPIPTCSPALYRPDIRPCDFFLFGDLKRKLKDEEFGTIEEPQARVEEFLGQVTLETMQQVSEHWVQRLQQVIHTYGDCV
jgi:hypothetical protein